MICQVVHSLNVGGAELLAANFARHAAERFRTVFACLDEIGELGDQLTSEGFDVRLLTSLQWL